METYIAAKGNVCKNRQAISLSKHTQDVLNVFNKLKNYLKNEHAHVIRLVELAILCHDWGKVLPAFQILTLRNNNYKPSSPLINIPHSFASLLWINESLLDELLEEKLKKGELKEIFSNNIEKTKEGYKKILFAAIAYHHWRENFFHLITSSRSDWIDFLESLTNETIQEMKKNLENEMCKVEEFEKIIDLIEYNQNLATGLINGVPLAEYAPPPYQFYFLPKRVILDEKIRKDWILIAGFLQRADHFASYCEEECTPIEFQNQYSPEISPPHCNSVKKKIKDRIISQIKNEDKSNLESNIWQFEELKKVYKNQEPVEKKNLLLIAPTGYGKTEFAFLWGSGQKLFYTLPLRAAVNQIYGRAKNVFGEDKVGLLHSDADVFLLGDGGEGQANLKAYDLARQLAYPAIISTGDQFFPYALRPPGYEKIYATFSYSNLVIDEIQAYNPQSAAIIVKFIEDVIHMGGKFLLMTATLPEFIRKEIQNTIKEEEFTEINLYEKEKENFEKIIKHKIKVELISKPEKEESDFTLPGEKLKEILNQAKQGKRVLVIVNTIKQAQDIYENLKKRIETEEYHGLKGHLWLLHSRFTLNHREKRQKEIGELFKNPKPKNECQGKILVATQVVEASLDIDADVLYTEIAPMDVLIQRMGRVLRRYGPLTPPNKIPVPEEPNVFVWVYQNGLQSGKNYVYDCDLLLLTLKLLKEKEKNGTIPNLKNWFEEKEKKKKNKKNDEFALSVLCEIFECPRDNKANKKNRTKRTEYSFKPFRLVCSEYDKYELVKQLYESLSETCQYLEQFRKTRDLLDAGYMADHKTEAEKMFRNIYNITIIPKNKKDEFLDKIDDFINFINKNKINYPLFKLFKKEVLAEFGIQVPFYLLFKKSNEWTRKEQKITIWLNEKLDQNSESKTMRRILHWCHDIYFADADYDEELGLKQINNSNVNEINEIIIL